MQRWPPRSGSRDRARWIALGVLCVGMLMIVLDVTVVNVALPEDPERSRVPASSLAWVVNAYLIAFGGLLLLAGRLGDLLGPPRRVPDRTGRVHIASLMCGIVDSQGVLIAARFVQGVGGAMTSAVILGMIVTMFPEPGEQAKAIGVYASWRRPAARSGCSRAECSPRRSAGTGSSSSTCRSASPGRAGDAGAASRRRHRARQGADALGAVLITGGADARRVHDRRAGGRAGLGLRRTRSRWARSRSALLVAFVVRQAAARTRCFRCGSSARATSRAPT